VGRAGEVEGHLGQLDRLARRRQSVAPEGGLANLGVELSAVAVSRTATAQPCPSGFGNGADISIVSATRSPSR
jgi:hypothetical protein